MAGFEPTTFGYADAHNNLGSALKDQDRLDEALYSYNKASTIKIALIFQEYYKIITKFN